MKYSRSAITQLTRWYRQVLIKCAILNAAIMAGTFGAPAIAEATEINQNGVPFQTNTTIDNAANPHIFNISTTTTNGAGNVGLNTFGKFNVSEGDTANLNLINQQNKLVNLVFDSSASQIDGIVNSYKNGQIGGDVLFANPNGFVVGKTGVFNVGSLTLMTPTEDTMKKVFKDNAVVEDNLNALVSFNMGGTDYLLLGGEETDIELNPAEISIDGTINSGSGITIVNGGTEININKDAKLNANMDFNVSGGKVTATKKSNVIPTNVKKTASSLEYKLAMDGGNGVTIVSKNQGVKDNYLAAIVNLNGKVDANGGHVVAQTETYQTGIKSAEKYDKNTQHNVALSKVSVGGEISGHDVALNARIEAKKMNNKLLSYDDAGGYLDWLGPNELNYLIADFFHMADTKASVEVLNTAKINAIGTFSANAFTSFNNTGIFDKSWSVYENWSFNYTQLDVVTEAILHSGSQVSSKNLNVLATTNVLLATNSQSTNIAEMAADAFSKSFGHYGSYAVTIALANISNRAVIEKEVALNVLKNIKVDAELYRTYNGTTKNGLIPVFDNNYGVAGIAAGVFVGNIVNEAIMNSSANIEGSLDVEANYIGSTVNNILASATAKGESSQAGIVGKIMAFYKDLLKFHIKGDPGNRSYTRAQGAFDKVKVAAGIGVSVDNVDNHAFIGDKEKGIKPNITAGNVILKSTLLDNKSNLYASSSAQNAETAVSAAIAVNVKNLNSVADAHGDFTITGNTSEYVAQKNGDYIILQDGSRLSANKGETIVIPYASYEWNPTEVEYTDANQTHYTITDSGITIKQGKGEFHANWEINSRGEKYINVHEDYIKQENGKIYLIDGDNLLDISQTNREVERYQTSGYSSKEGQVFAYTYRFSFDKMGQTTTTLPNGDIIEASLGDKVYLPTGGLFVDASTTVTHGLSWGDWLPDLFKWTDNLFNGSSKKNNAASVKDIETQDANDYLSATTNAKDIQQKINDAGNLNILNGIDFNVLGLAQLFNTFASSSAVAAAKEDANLAVSGAITVAVTNTVAKAVLDDSSSVLFKGENLGQNTLTVNAYTNDQLWSGAALLGLINNITSGLGGNSSRDGSSGGGALSFQWGSPDTIANIGQNVKITTEEGKTQGDIIVKALDETDDINVAIANGQADETGIAGAISISAVDNGKVEAAIKSSDASSSVNGRDVTVTANKDLTHVNANVAFTSSQKDVGLGLAINYVDDTAESYIAGNVNALRNITVKSDYDKLFVNGAVNVGYARTGSDTPKYDRTGYFERMAKESEANDLIDKAKEQRESSKWYNFGTFKSLWNYRKANETLANSKFDFTRAVNPDKNTFAASGILSVSISEAASKAYIADGAKVYSGNNIEVKATSEDQMIGGALATALHGKTGLGGAFIGQYSGNAVEAYIGNAVVDAWHNINVEAKEDLKLFTGSVGIAQAENTAAAGNLSLDIQQNKITAAIKDGAKINTLKDGAEQSVDVKAGLETKIIKGVGSVGVQTGGTGGKGAIGATLDGDIAVNEVNAYIKNAQVNAGKYIDVAATNYTNLTTVDVSGAVSTKNSSYAGTLGAYVSINEENAYIEGSQINKTNGRTNKNADVNVKASSVFDDLAIVGTVAYGSESSGDGSVRVDGIGDQVRSYIKNSTVETTGKVELDNNLTYEYLAVTAAGTLSQGNVSVSGAVAVAVNSALQDNYIENSTINADSLTMDTDTTYDVIAITGAASISTKGTAVGGSIFVDIVDNDVNTYIKNSNITAQNDINLTSDMNVDSLSIIFAGSGGKGLAVSGAINTIVNAADVNTYILSESGDKKVESKAGKVVAKSTDITDIDTINGAISISLGNKAIGGAISTVVDNSDVTAGIQGLNVSAKKDVDIEAKSEENIMSISIGGAGGKDVTVAGSINTVVMTNDTDAYIKNAEVSSLESDVKVKATGTSVITGGTGAASISLGNAAIGASIVTGVIDNEVTAVIENSKVNAGQDVLVNAIANETIGSSDAPFITVAGGFSKGLTLEGVIGTMIMSSTADAHIKGTKIIDNVAYGITAGRDAKITASGEDNLFAIDGSVSASMETGIGATINTLVVDKETLAYGENTKIQSDRNIEAQTTETDNFLTTVIAAAGGGTAGAAGAVNTNVVTSKLESGFKNSELKSGNNISSNAQATANMQTYTGAAAGGGTAGVGLSAVNDVIKYDIQSYVTKADAQFKELNVKATADSTYDFKTVSGSGGGTVGVVGVENVNYVNNTVKAYADGKLTGTDGALADKASVEASDKVTFDDPIAGVVTGGGTAGVGASVMVNSVTSTVEASLGGNDIKAGDIDVKASAEQNYDGVFAAGFAGGGEGAFAGTVIVNSVDTIVKSYLLDNSKVTAQDVDITSQNNVNLTSFAGAAALGGMGALGASVMVNDFAADTESYTGENVTINAENVNVKAQTTTDLGTEDSKLNVVAGSVGLYAGIAGSFLFNDIENKTVAYIGKDNKINLADYGKLDIEATDKSTIYEGFGAGAGGLVGVGASVGGNEIHNTVLAYINTGSKVEGANADVSITAKSEENVDALAVIVGAGGVALSGGAVYTNIGKKVSNASYNSIEDAEEKKTIVGAKDQTATMQQQSDKITKAADESYKSGYNDALKRVAHIDLAKEGRQSSIKEVSGSLYAKASSDNNTTTPQTDATQTAITSSAGGREGTTSAFIDTLSELNIKNLKVNAENKNDLKTQTDGLAAGAGAIGVSVSLTEDLTTTGAFVSNNVKINAQSAEIIAKSQDTQDINSMAASGGIIAGGGSHAQINSNKTTNAYVLGNTEINTKNNLTIKTDSTSDVTANADAGGIGGVAVGISVAKADTTGDAMINIGENVKFTSKKGNVTIQTNTNEKAQAISWAATGGAYSGSGAAAVTKTGKTNRVNIARNFVADVAGKLTISSNAKNDAYAEASGRAYGGLSAGGASGDAIIQQTSGVGLVGADKASETNPKKLITAGDIEISSNVNNKADTVIYAGSGAFAGASGSNATIDITSSNYTSVGDNYDITATKGKYLVSADTLNEYKGYDKSDAYGAITAAFPSVKNTISSTVSSSSYADVVSSGAIAVVAKNEVKKNEVTGYDLYGGSGGVYGGSGGVLNDAIVMNTYANLGGGKAYANGAYEKGDVTVGAYNIANINEKADLYAHGLIGGTKTNSIVRLTADAKTEIANKDIKAADDNINFVARNDVDIYTKVNVESYGGFMGTGGTSEAATTKQYANVVISDGVKSVSGRDTNISAINKIGLKSYIYERTRGMFSAISGYSNALNEDAKAIITINSGADLKSYDAMNIISQNAPQDASKRVSAERDAIAYQLWGIPFYGSGNITTTDKNSAVIVLNGSVESGLGAHKSLVINKDGTYESNGIVVKGKQKVDEITLSDIDADIKLFEDSKTAVKEAYDKAIAYQKGRRKELQDTINANTAKKEALEAQNTNYQNNIEIINASNNIDSNTFAATYANSTITEIANLVSALTAETPDADAIATAKAALLAKRTGITDSIYQINEKIKTNKNTIEHYASTIQINTADIKYIDEHEIPQINDQYDLKIADLDNSINALKAQKQDVTSIPVYSIYVEDTTVRSGETNLMGSISGSGSIAAPNGGATIDIVNNSVNDVVYGDLIIDRNAKGGIIAKDGLAASSLSNISTTLKGNSDSAKISILNTIDANEPTVDFSSNAGDIILKGNVDNVNGTFEVTNNTGNILSEGSMTARNLKIRVPNGAYSQAYTNQELKSGGDSGNGAIVASGDIDIAAKIINVNGLIQSGSEIKTVTIPEFSVTKEEGKYYQTINGVKTEMKPSEMTDGYYYLTLADSSDDLAAIQQIKAYFKPTDNDAISDVPGEIHLFKASIDGGNITLTGNIVNDKNTGKIVLLNGYGHIDIVNNSNYDLVTSAINADTKGQGTLTINDFKVATGSNGAPDYSPYENLTQSELTKHLTDYADIHTAYVNESGEIKTDLNKPTANNGTWGTSSKTTRADGAIVYSTTYTPGQDAYKMTSAGQPSSYQVYIKRSWWTELWYGKKYETRYYITSPTYEVKNTPITVNFQGFDKPVINVTSNGTGNVIMNNNISALVGDVNIVSQGDILTNSTKNVISANSITLQATGNIGQKLSEDTIKSVQIDVMDNGTLKTDAKNIYINFPHNDISNVELNAGNGTGDVYLATDNGTFNGEDKNIKIIADALDLRANNINLDASNENVDISINKLKARVEDDISITNKGDLTISSIVSKNKGNVSIESKEGSIFAAADTGTFSNYHIDGGNVVLRAINGGIGNGINGGLIFANKGIFNVKAKDDVILSSAGAIYVDLIESTQGMTLIVADYGIIASQITDADRYYNIGAKNSIVMTTSYGNIENIALNTDGVVAASASRLMGDGDVNIAMVSQKPLTKDSTQEEIDAFNANAKDLKIGLVHAGQNITISSEKGVYDGNNEDWELHDLFGDEEVFGKGIIGERIAINAVGNIGTQDAPVALTANREITVSSSYGSNVYLTAPDEQKGMKINTIDVTGEGTLNNVVITSKGNISNVAAKSENNEAVNIRADNIVLSAEGQNIGSKDDYLVVETTSDNDNKGLVYSANQSYIKGVGAKLNITQGQTTDTSVIHTDEDTSIVASNITSGDDIQVISNADVKLNNATAASVVIDGREVTISDNVTADYVGVKSTGTTTFEDAEVKYLTDEDISTALVDVVSDDDVIVKDTVINGDTKITSKEDTNISTLKVDGNFSNTSDNTTVSGTLDVTGDANIDADKDVEITEVTAGSLTIEAENADITKSSTAGDTNITTEGDTKIAEAIVGGNFNNTSGNNTISGKLDVIGDANIDANKNIVIADANIGKDLNADAENIKIAEMKLDGNINAKVDDLSVNTSNDLHIGTISGNTTDYTNTADITSLKNITNGLDNADTNISVKNANLTAGNSIGEDKALNMELAEGNKVNITAGNVANLNNTGAAANYGNVTADDTKITATNDVNIANLNTDKLALTTQSENVNITGDIKTKGTIDTSSKNIVVDNTSLSPYPDATVQLHLTQKPMHLIVDKNNNIKTESQNVIRQDKNILINKETNAASMEGEITLASETALRNSYHGKDVEDEADDSLYNNSTVSDYISSVVGSRDHLVTDDNGSLINNLNVMDIIRQKTPHKSVNQNLSQDDERKKKSKGNLKKAEATVLKNIDVAAILRK